VKKFLHIMKDPSNYPVLAHCSRGKERGGVMVAAYRIRVNGWTVRQALREMERSGFDPDQQPEMWAMVQRLARDRSQ